MISYHNLTSYLRGKNKGLSFEQWLKLKFPEQPKFSSQTDRLYECFKDSAGLTKITSETVAGQLLNILQKTKNKGISFENWRNNKKLESQKKIKLEDKKKYATGSLERMFELANEDAFKDWLKQKNIEMLRRDQAMKNQQMKQRVAEVEFEIVKGIQSRKAFNYWLKIKKTEKKVHKMKTMSDDRMRNTYDQILSSKRIEFNKKSRKDWLKNLRSRNN